MAVVRARRGSRCKKANPVKAAAIAIEITITTNVDPMSAKSRDGLIMSGPSGSAKRWLTLKTMPEAITMAI